MAATAEKPVEPVAAAIVPFRQSSARDRITPAKLGIQSLISAGTTFVGDIESIGGMKIDGNIVGNVAVRSETDAWVLVAATAVVEGNITARVVAVCGCVKGSIRAKHIALMPTARIDGDIFYEVLRISEGATVNGRLNQIEPGTAAHG